MQSFHNAVTLLAFFLIGIYNCSAGTILYGVLNQNIPSSTERSALPHPIPSRDTPLSEDILAKEKRDPEIPLSSLDEAYLYDVKTPAEYDGFDEKSVDSMAEGMKNNDAGEEESKRALDTLGNMQIHGYKRTFDNLGNMQIHGYKRRFDNLGGVHLHGGYKRYISSLGGGHLHAYKRSLDNLGGAFIPKYKRYLSSLGGRYIHGGYKRGDDRFLSSLGGSYIYKRRLDNLGGMHLHSGYKRYLSTLGGGYIHDGGSSKRTLSSLGGMNIHDGIKRDMSSASGEPMFEYASSDEVSGSDLDKRGLDTLGGYVHRYRRSDINNNSAATSDDEKTK